MYKKEKKLNKSNGTYVCLSVAYILLRVELIWFSFRVKLLIGPYNFFGADRHRPQKIIPTNFGVRTNLNSTIICFQNIA